MAPSVQTNRPALPSGRTVLYILLILAAALRIWNLPARNEVRDWDEVGYACDGLVLWEGISPGWESTPAGPQAWEGWLFAAGRSGWEYLHTPAGTPKMIKPLLAINQALFKTYEDLGTLRLLLIWVSIGTSLIGVYGGYLLGARYGGAAGGLLTGGVVAFLPMYIEFAGYAKSCTDAWMLAIAAVACAAAATGGKRRWLPGVLLGLGIGSRIDMVVVAPLVLWALWENPISGMEWWKAMLAALGITVAMGLLSAPYAMQGFVGIFRQIGLSKGEAYWGAEAQRTATFTELMGDQGLGPIMLLAIAGILLVLLRGRLKHVVLVGYAVLMAASIFMGHHQPMRYNGGPLIVILAGVALTTGAILRRLPRSAMALAVLMVALPFVQSVRAVLAMKQLYTPENAVEWIDEHIPAGTTVYLHPGFNSRAVLPTPAAADAIWAIISNDQTWKLKLEDASKRFSLPEEQIPRALSEDNLVKDRGFCRRWFILGGGQSDRPRYDVRLVAMSATFGLKRDEVGGEFKKTGGVVLWQTRSGGMPPRLGEPFKKWVNHEGEGVLIFVSPDLQEKLKGKS